MQQAENEKIEERGRGGSAALFQISVRPKAEEAMMLRG